MRVSLMPWLGTPPADRLSLRDAGRSASRTALRPLLGSYADGDAEHETAADTCAHVPGRGSDARTQREADPYP